MKTIHIFYYRLHNKIAYNKIRIVTNDLVTGVIYFLFTKTVTARLFREGVGSGAHYGT